MVVTASYHDLCKEIQLLELRVKDLHKEYNFYMGMFEGKRPRLEMERSIKEDRVQTSSKYMPPDVAYAKCVEINELLVQYDELITSKLKTKAEIEKGMSEFETLEGKINYHFHVQNLKLYEIADKLGYSYEWIRHVKSRHDRAQRQHKK